MNGTNVGSGPQESGWLAQSTGDSREDPQVAGLPSSSFTVINNDVSAILKILMGSCASGHR